MNICAIGRTPKLSQEARGVKSSHQLHECGHYFFFQAFEKADNSSGFRRRLVSTLEKEFGPDSCYRLNFRWLFSPATSRTFFYQFRSTLSIGGQIGIDVCPCGWDKTFCLQFISEVILTEFKHWDIDKRHFCINRRNFLQFTFLVIDVNLVVATMKSMSTLALQDTGVHYYIVLQTNQCI